MTLKPSFFQNYIKCLINLLSFFLLLQLPMGIQTAFFIHSRTVLSSLTQKKFALWLSEHADVIEARTLKVVSRKVF